ncbi:unnamed protein product [Effrenium voratum]|nr:unnamed protein product [Effrenium voratum]
MSGDKMKPAPRPEYLPLPRLAKKDMHDIGLCVPCLFYTTKGDGCRKGDGCSHCHFCTKQEVKARRRVLRAWGMKHDIDVVQEDSNRPKAVQAVQCAAFHSRGVNLQEAACSYRVHWISPSKVATCWWKWRKPCPNQLWFMAVTPARILHKSEGVWESCSGPK